MAKYEVFFFLSGGVAKRTYVIEAVDCISAMMKVEAEIADKKSAWIQFGPTVTGGFAKYEKAAIVGYEIEPVKRPAG